MTKREALAEARRRWGRSAYTVSTNPVLAQRFGVRASYHVGFVGMERGTGNTWEAAFADADRREKGA